MIESLRIITGNQLNKLTGPTIWSAFMHAMKGIPYSFLFLILLTLFKHTEEPGSNLDTGTLTMYIIGLMASLVIQYFLTNKAYEVLYKQSYGLIADSRIRLGEHLRKLPMGFFKDRDPGDATALLLQDMDKVESIFTHSYSDLISCIAFPAVIAVFLLLADWRLTAAMLVTLGVALIVLVILLKIMVIFSKKQINARNNAIARTLEYLHGIRVIKAYNQIGKRFSRLDDANLRMKKECIKLEAIPGPFLCIFISILELGFVIAMLMGTYYVLEGNMSTSIFLLFLVLGYQFLEPIRQMAFFIAEMRYMTVAADRISAVLGEKPLPEPEDDVRPERFDIEFQDVTFAYHNKDVIRNASIRIPERSITALVGPSGSGKTTVTNLIARFWDVDLGKVMLGGRDVREYKADTLLSCMSMVFQDVYLFNDTIFNNIKIGKKDATREQIVAAAKAARCHDFIEKLPKGYDTMVGEGGATLSGGEKQRISIARAILKDAPIILLDEATASLDPENEYHIQQAIDELVRSKTVVMIAHRLNTVAKADQIIVLDQGRVVEAGKHDELISNGGLYNHLWGEQQKAHGWKLGA